VPVPPRAQDAHQEAYRTWFVRSSDGCKASPCSHIPTATSARMLPHDPVLADAGQLVHLWGAWVVYVIIAMHVAAVGWHELNTGNSALVRMLPSWRRKFA
jgi:cytochrome b561